MDTCFLDHLWLWNVLVLENTQILALSEKKKLNLFCIVISKGNSLQQYLMNQIPAAVIQKKRKKPQSKKKLIIKKANPKTKPAQESMESFFGSILSFLRCQLWWKQIIECIWTMSEMCGDWNGFVHFPDPSFLTESLWHKRRLQSKPLLAALRKPCPQRLVGTGTADKLLLRC